MFHFFQLLTFIPYNNSHFLNIMKNIDMNTELASAFLHVERIPEYITPPTYDTMFFSLFTSKMEFLLYKLCYRLTHSLCCPLGLTC